MLKNFLARNIWNSEVQVALKQDDAKKLTSFSTFSFLLMIKNSFVQIGKFDKIENLINWQKPLLVLTRVRSVRQVWIYQSKRLAKEFQSNRNGSFVAPKSELAGADPVAADIAKLRQEASFSKNWQNDALKNLYLTRQSQRYHLHSDTFDPVVSLFW